MVEINDGKILGGMKHCEPRGAVRDDFEQSVMTEWGSRRCPSPCAFKILIALPKFPVAGEKAHLLREVMKFHLESICDRIIISSVCRSIKRQRSYIILWGSRY